MRLYCVKLRKEVSLIEEREKKFPDRDDNPLLAISY